MFAESERRSAWSWLCSKTWVGAETNGQQGPPLWRPCPSGGAGCCRKGHAQAALGIHTSRMGKAECPWTLHTMDPFLTP